MSNNEVGPLYHYTKLTQNRDFLVVNWLRLCTPNAGGPGSIPDHGTRFHMLKLRASMPKLKIPCVCAQSLRHVSLRLHRLQHARFLCPWNFPSKSTAADCHFLLQRIFPTQGLNSISCILRIGR